MRGLRHIFFLLAVALLTTGCGDGTSNPATTPPDASYHDPARLTASDAEDGDLFGISVSISGDYAIVGAWGEDGAGVLRGAAYVFHRNQGGTDNWGEVMKLTASDAEDGDHFGISVSISGDDAIVGALSEGGGLSLRGAAYLY
jgi:hypothetical protein